MLNLSKTCRYAIRALFYLVNNPQKNFIKINEIADEEKIPLNYLRKIFQRLIKEKIVMSGLGPTGGVKLASNSQKISILRIIKIFDGKLSLNECSLLGYKNCPNFKNCPIQKECRKYSKEVIKKLSEFKLKDFKDVNKQAKVLKTYN